MNKLLFHRVRGTMCYSASKVIISLMLTISFFCSFAYGKVMKQKSFASPEKAVEALIDAIKRNNTNDLLSIFGPEGKEIIFSGDEIRDRDERKRFLQAFQEKSGYQNRGTGMVFLYVGDKDWPFPIPIVKRGASWRFDTLEGKEEILSRRIGRNELNVIETMKAFVVAQREYYGKDRDMDQIKEYAQKFLSTEGEKDGLYWEPKEGEEKSPFGPLVAAAANEGYTKKKADNAIPYQGYYYRILKGQGENARGGAYNFVVHGHMIFGFGLIAYPAEYGSSGIMTFIVNQGGFILEKDLGENTEKIVESIMKYDPNGTWNKSIEQ